MGNYFKLHKTNSMGKSKKKIMKAIKGDFETLLHKQDAAEKN